MIRRTMLIAAALGLVAGPAGVALAQAAPATPTDFKYELRGNERVEKPDSRTKAADGTVREEFRSGKCVTVKERRPDGAVKTSQKCD
ncbi:hypothetical protein [Sphingomonas mesophila]|uniref:hypothetical protein n=1 Tax=Sphingomonas mesophila TaxID=2303576 RepID=UPI000E58C2FE|nr:hypothetical protein [Sphingomonas mesophila]